MPAQQQNSDPHQKKQLSVVDIATIGCYCFLRGPHPAEPPEGSTAMAITLTLIGAAIGAIVGLMLADLLDRRARRAAIVKRIRRL